MSEPDENQEPLSIYVAGCWARKDELFEFASNLQDLGYHIASSWLWSEGESDHDPTHWGEYAIRDIRDIADADAFVLFTEASSVPRNSRLVELGFALAFGKEVIIVGPRENIFCYLNPIHHCETIERFWLEVNDGEEVINGHTS